MVSSSPACFAAGVQIKAKASARASNASERSKEYVRLPKLDGDLFGDLSYIETHAKEELRDLPFTPGIDTSAHLNRAAASLWALRSHLSVALFGPGRKQLDAALDHRHTYGSYRQFMLRTIAGIERVLKQDGIAVLVIGDVKDPGKDPVPLAAQMWKEVKGQCGLRLIEMVEDDLPTQNKVSRIWGDTKGQATNRDCALVLAHQNGEPDLSRTDIHWDEPWKDGGPDAAHERFRAIRAKSG